MWGPRTIFLLFLISYTLTSAHADGSNAHSDDVGLNDNNSVDEDLASADVISDLMDGTAPIDHTIQWWAALLIVLAGLVFVSGCLFALFRIYANYISPQLEDPNSNEEYLQERLHLKRGHAGYDTFSDTRTSTV